MTAIIRYRSKIIALFFHRRALARARERDRTRAKCTEIIDSASARAAIARLDDGSIINITDFYNCLVDQTMVSSTQLTASFPGIHSARVSLADPFDEFYITMTFADSRASLWHKHEKSQCGSWQF